MASKQRHEQLCTPLARPSLPACCTDMLGLLIGLTAPGWRCCLQAVRSLRESVDLSRLSRIALSNLEKDDGVTDYTAAQPATAGGDITIDSTDAELDFEEVADQGRCNIVLRLWC
jgi:hypothetical protein